MPSSSSPNQDAFTFSPSPAWNRFIHLHCQGTCQGLSSWDNLLSSILSHPRRISLGAISSDGIGHFTELIRRTTQQCPYPLTLHTMFTSQGGARARPFVQFSEPARPIPPHPVPQSVEGSYTAWLLGPKIYSGKEIDAASEQITVIYIPAETDFFCFDQSRGTKSPATSSN